MVPSTKLYAEGCFVGPSPSPFFLDRLPPSTPISKPNHIYINMNADRRTKLDILKAQDGFLSLVAPGSRWPIIPSNKPSPENVSKSSKKRHRSPEADASLDTEINKLDTSGTNARRVLKARKESPWAIERFSMLASMVPLL